MGKEANHLSWCYRSVMDEPAASQKESRASRTDRSARTSDGAGGTLAATDAVMAVAAGDEIAGDLVAGAS